MLASGASKNSSCQQADIKDIQHTTSIVLAMLSCDRNGMSWFGVHTRHTGPAGFQSTLQHTFFRRACRVKSSIPIEVVFQELFVTPWHMTFGGVRFSVFGM